MSGSSSQAFSGFLWKLGNLSMQEDLMSQLEGVLDEETLVRYASNLRQGKRCSILRQRTHGGVHSIRLLEFEDGVRWLARIQLRPSNESSILIMQSEVDTMNILSRRTRVPVPSLYSVEVLDSNPVGRPFMLMECLMGNAVMDLDGGYEVHGGHISEHRKPRLHRAFAAAHVEMSSIRFPQIGMILKRDDGTFQLGPIPGLGGPFDSAKEFFNSWAEVYHRFPRSEKSIRSMCGDLADEVLSSIQAFPSKLREWVHDPSPKTSGPFPLQHPDTYLSNVLVDDGNHIVGIIDWEGAHTVPWELVAVPTFLEPVAPLLDVPWNYDANGHPTDPEIRQLWAERDAYITLVAEAEKMLEHADDKLSMSLRNKFQQHLSYAVRVWPDGKVGLYDRIFQ